MTGKGARVALPRPIAIRLRVDNLPFATTVDDLERLFRKAGPVQSIDIARHAETGFPCGFAIVVMANPTAVFDAIARFDGFTHRGHLLAVGAESSRGPADRPGRPVT
jgi:RNA recognition motif-containing protein